MPIVILLLVLGPVFIIWATFGPLAYRNQRHGLLYTFLAIVLYIGALILFGFLLDYADSNLRFPYFIDRYIDYAALPLAYGSTWLLYYLLKRSWEKQRPGESETLLDDSTDD